MKKLLIIILAGAFISRFIAGYFFVTEIRDEYKSPSKNDFNLAHNLINYGTYSLDGITPSAIHTPLYPLSIAAISMFNNTLLVLLFHCLVGTLTIILSYKIGKLLFSDNVGLLSALVLTLNPYQIRNDLRADRYCLYVFLFALSLYLILKYIKSRHIQDCLSASAALALCFLTKEEGSLVIGFFIVILLVTKQFSHLLLTALVLFSMISPWWIRNYYSMRHFVMTRTDGGATVYTSNCDLSLNFMPDYQLHITLLPYVQNLASSYNFHCEVERDSFYYAKTREFVFKNPISYAKLCLWRLSLSILPIRKPDLVTQKSTYYDNQLKVETVIDRNKFAKNFVYFALQTWLIILFAMSLRDLSKYQMIPLIAYGLLLIFHSMTVSGMGFKTHYDFILTIFASSAILRNYE